MNPITTANKGISDFKYHHFIVIVYSLFDLSFSLKASFILRSPLHFQGTGVNYINKNDKTEQREAFMVTSSFAVSHTNVINLFKSSET